MKAIVRALRKGGPRLGLLRAVIVGLFVVSIPLALITTNIRVAISEQRVYDYSVRTYDADRVSGIPEDELIRANGEIRRYLTTEDAGPLSIKVTDRSGETVPLFNSREVAHMADVRELVRPLLDIQVIAVAGLLALAVGMMVLWDPRALAAGLLYGALLTGGIIGAGGLLAVAGFEAAWEQFHVFAFTNDLYRLDPDTDHLIQMFPEAFWQRVTLLIGAITVLEAALIAAAAGAYLMLTRQAEQADDDVVKPVPMLPGPAGHARPRIAPPNPR